MSVSKCRFAIDRGGTFTDVFAQVPVAPGFVVLKLLSVNPSAYADAPTEGIRRVLQLVTGAPITGRIPCDRIESIRMGTTVATNALLERRGVPTALVITRGFHDLLAIGTQARPDLFALAIRKAQQIYARVIECDERVRVVPLSGAAARDPHVLAPLRTVQSATGDTVEVLVEPDLGALRAQLVAARAAGVDSVAVVLMHSYAYPDHERLVGALARELGFRHVSLSCETVDSIRIVQRGFTTSVDAYLTPLVRDYVAQFRQGFENLDSVAVSFMKSDGGLCPVADFNGFSSILSGPAGGVVGYAKTAFDPAERTPVIAFDMGGTSTDVSRYDGEFHHVFETQTAGVHILAPQLEISTVAAGGGSRLFFRAGLFLVGPESAGANPGPACYGRGGPLAITDANLLLGRLQPQHFPRVFGASGAEPLDPAASCALVERELLPAINEFAAATGGAPRSVEEIALGFVRVANEAMCRPIRALMQRYGLSAARHALAAFGSAGPQHACALARALGVPRVEIHRHCGVLSAFGIGLADSVREAQRVMAVAYSATAGADYDAMFEAMAAPLRESLLREGIAPSNVVVHRFLHLRYRGTDTAIMVPRPADGDYPNAFVRLHTQEYGFWLHDRPLEIDHVRVRVVGRSSVDAHAASGSHAAAGAAGGSGAPLETVRCFFDGGWADTPVFDLDRLPAGTRLQGPCLILLPTSTAVIEPGCEALVTPNGSLQVLIDTSGAASSSLASKAVTTAYDIVQLSVFTHRFMSVAEQMGNVLRRTAISVNIKERLDFSCALFAPDGKLVANGPAIPVHIGSMQSAVRFQIEHLGGEWRDGDVIMSNHPEAGGTHLPDITVITPVFHEKRPVFFVASRGHHADIGGISPGSMPPFSKSLGEEGVCFKSVRIVRDGVFDDEGVARVLTTPPMPGVPATRLLNDNLSDLKAMVAANQRGILLVRQLIDEYSLPVVQAYMAHVQQAAADAVRSMLAKIGERVAAERGEPDARIVQVQSTDNMDCGTPISLRLTIDRDKRSAFLDFSGTGEQVITNINAPQSVTIAAVIYSLRCLVDEDIPLNSGCLDPVTIHIPKGSILSPSDDAAVVGGNVLTSQRVTDVVLTAFGAAANSMGDMSNFTFGTSTSGYYETIGGGSGAGPTWDGASGVQTHMTNTRITDPEVVERRFPVLLKRFQFRHGSGGDGAHRGGDGLIRELQFLAPMTASILSERRSRSPHGFAGGEDAAAGLNLLHRARDNRTINITG
jgi:5-oxoprolinase (ATP-hydrolysing)